MAGWPLTGRYVDAAPGVPIPSGLDNELQDRILDINKRHPLHLALAYCGEGSGVKTWLPFDMTASDFEAGWKNITFGHELVFPFDGRRSGPNGSKIYAVEAKVQSAGASNLVANLYKVTTNIDSPGTAPSIGSSLATATATGGAGVWDELLLTPASPVTLSADERLIIVFINGTSAGDRIATVRVDQDPLVPTP